MELDLATFQRYENLSDVITVFCLWDHVIDLLSDFTGQMALLFRVHFTDGTRHVRDEIFTVRKNP